MNFEEDAKFRSELLEQRFKEFKEQSRPLPGVGGAFWFSMLRLRQVSGLFLAAAIAPLAAIGLITWWGTRD